MAKNDDFYLNRGIGGYFSGRTLIQASGKIGGHRSVFVNIVGNRKDALRYPTFGGVLLNPFKGRAKIYAGDLVEYDPGIEDTETGPSVKIMKVFELAKNVVATDKTIKVVRNGYRHVPFIGDNIMAAPSTLDGKGTGLTVVGVTETKEGGSVGDDCLWCLSNGIINDTTRLLHPYGWVSDDNAEVPRQYQVRT